MKIMPEISVIMPVYNCEEFLDESLNSILNQTFTDFEVLCVDDGSTDSSLDILNEYANNDNRFKVYHQENMGGGVARNFALTQAKGEYIFFIDSDDKMELNALEETFNCIEKEDVDFLIFKAYDYDYINDKCAEIDYFTMPEIYDIVGDDPFHYSDIGELIFRMSATPWGKLYNKQFILDCGAQFGKTKAFHDNEFFWKALFSSEKIIFCNKTLYYRRINPNSLQNSRDERYLDIIPVFNDIVGIFEQAGEVDNYKKRLYNWRIDVTNYRLSQIQDQYKEFFVENFKDDLSKLTDKLGYDELIGLLDESNKHIYNNILNASSYNEYKLKMEKIELKNQVKELEEKNKELKKQYKNLKKPSVYRRILRKIKKTIINLF